MTELHCPDCGSLDIRRSRRSGFVDMGRSALGFLPYRCMACLRRFNAAGGGGAGARWIALAAAIAVLAGASYFAAVRLAPRFAPESHPSAAGKNSVSRHTLTNEDVQNMVTSGMSRTAIDARISTSNTAFDLSAEGLAQLRHNGVPEAVVSLMIARGVSSGPPPVQTAGQ